MGQKVHPNGFRLGYSKAHAAEWYRGKDLYSFALQEDMFIRNYFQKHYAKARIANIVIQRTALDVAFKVKVVIGRPKALGSKGDAETMVAKFNENLKKFRAKTWPQWERPDNKLDVNFLVADEASTAALLAQELADQLEKRIPFRRAMKTVMQRVSTSKVFGVKMQVSGRLNGAEIARTEWIRQGRVPLQQLDADIDYHACTASTIYGILGIKIWLYRGRSELIPSSPTASPVAQGQPKSKGAKVRVQRPKASAVV